jgi:hypothetical protein
LRKELLLAMGEGGNTSMQLYLSPVELSLQVAVAKAGDGLTGWKVLGLGGSFMWEEPRH